MENKKKTQMSENSLGGSYTPVGLIHHIIQWSYTLTHYALYPNKTDCTLSSIHQNAENLPSNPECTPKPNCNCWKSISAPMMQL